MVMNPALARWVIDEFSSLNAQGSIVIGGGEPTLDRDLFFEVCRIGRRKNLKVLTITNGSRITTVEEATRLVLDGPDELSISLDGPTEALHDKHRGTKGAFERAIRAIRLVVKARNLHNTPTKIYVIGLLAASTSRLLREFYTLVLSDLGADKLKLNVVQPTFVNNRISEAELVATPQGLVPQMKVHDKFFEQESQISPEFLANELEYCEETFRLHFNPEWKRQVVSYFRLLWQKPNLHLGWGCGLETDEIVCNSLDRNIFVDVQGQASSCPSIKFSNKRLTEPGDLTAFWVARSSHPPEGMSTCKSLCGMCHAMRRESATVRS